MKSPPRLPLNALRVFEAVARNGSMARAAEALNVLPSAVSMQMKNLADYVGVPLVVMRGRRLELTAHGEKILPGVLAGLSRIDAAVAALRDDIAGRPFTLSVLPSFLHLWLMPRLSSFEAANPSFQLQILSHQHVVDLLQENVDAAVRLGAGTWPGVKATKLMDESLVPICAPGLRKQAGRLEPGMLPKGVRLLHSSIDPWNLWTGSPIPAKTAIVAIDDAMAIITAAEQGRGVALARSSLCQLSIKAGHVIAVGEPIPYRFAYYWVSKARLPADRSGGALFKWIKAQASAG